MTRKNAVSVFLSLGTSIALATFAVADKSSEPGTKFEPLPDLTSKYLTVTTREIKHGDVTIVIGNARTKEEAPNDLRPYACAAWLSIRKDGVEIERVVYSDIEAVGSSFGLFIPRTQPSPDYVMAVKCGDYDSRLLIVDKQGELTDLPGGSYYMTKDKKHIVSEYLADWSIVAVFDLKSGKSRRSDDLPFHSYDWYHSSWIGYFCTECEWTDTSGQASERQDTIHVLDFENARFRTERVDVKSVKDAERIKQDFDPRDYSDCTCADETDKDSAVAR